MQTIYVNSFQFFSVADPGCLYRIRLFPSGARIRIFHSGSGSLLFTHPKSRIRSQKGTGSRIRIRNTEFFRSTETWNSRTGGILEQVNQCCGSGSTGSTCFWASRIRIRIHKPEVWIRILLSSCKNSKKKPWFLLFCDSFWLFIFEKWCKCTFKK